MSTNEMYSFDSYKFVKDFLKASNKEAQGERIAKTITESRHFDLAKLATKDQLELVRQELKQEIRISEERLAAE